MGSMTFEVETWNVASKLRAEFAEPAAHEPADAERLKAILAEIRKVAERVRSGDTKIYSDVFGCWIKVID